MLITAASAAVAPPPARAAPNGQISCAVYFYYSSPKKTTLVGTFPHCPGGVDKGRKTPWFNIETFKIGPPPTSGSVNGGINLPCEFLAAGCPNWPTPRP